MYLLPLLAGLLLFFQGHGHSVLAERNGAAGKSAHAAQELRHRLQQLIDYEKRVNNLNNVKSDKDLAFKEVPENKVNSEVNLAADENTVNRDVQPDNNNNNENSGAGDTTKSPTTAVHHAGTPQAQQAGPNDGHIGLVNQKDFMFIAVISACSIAGLVGLIMAGVCWYKLHSRVKAASDVDYPAYGVTGPTKERLPSPGDRKLAQSAQMYHYQHQKQQMIAMEKANGEMKHDASEDESEEENEEGDYTVYECPGLAPTGEMEVRNPLFTEEPQTPVNGQTTVVNGIHDDGQE